MESGMKKWMACIVMTAVLLASVGTAELVEALGIDTEAIQNWMHREQTVETIMSIHGERATSVVSSVAVQNAKVGKWVLPNQDELQYYGLDDFETNLPIVHINTGGQRVSKENKIGAYLSVTEAAEGKARSIMETPDWDASILLNYRGASSYSQFDKKQYRIKFVKKQGSDKAKEVAFLGMGENSEWVLNGPFLDKTLIRNKLVYDLGRELFEWAPDSRYCEVFVDGKYQGVYLAVEPVTNGEGRLRLCEFGLANGQTAYIVKRDRSDTEENPLDVYGHYMGKTNNDLFIDYPGAKRLTDVQREWITADIDAFERVLYNEHFADPKDGYAKYIDVDNFVDYVVLNEVVMNNDAGNLSTYIYKELGGKFQIAIWDYNNCFDNYQWFPQAYDESFLKESAWFSQLLKDPVFVNKVVTRYHDLRDGILSEAYLNEQIDARQALLGDAIDRNFAIWGYTFYEHLVRHENGLHTNPKSYDEAIGQLKKSMHTRLLYLDEHFADLYKN